MSEEELFAAALERPADERAAFLDAACAGDVTLRGRVEGLLRSHEWAGSFLDPPPPGPDFTAALDRPAEGTGTRVGPYKLLQQLGEGGMGVVYVAEQERPVKRRVALKVVKPGMDSAQVLRRFEAERQALALMDHTNIAKVFDAGATAAGRLYFVMELVKGVPITRYCDELNLTLGERLTLFVPVCRAIQHAHQKGVVHRDVKPSNVLVTIQDGNPVPKVIDFGVAKALHQRLTEGSVYTEIGAVVGTLEYMAPEQAELSALDVDTRADVYALGVLLYELLTGSTPRDRGRLRSAAFAEMLRIIKEEEPPRPSTRLTRSGDSLAGLAARRRTEPARLAREVRGELDWIAMKALEKDRTRRYEAASDLARDVERYLADEPVEACPPSRLYRLRTFARRNRAALGAAAAVGLAVLVAVGGVGWAVRDRSARQARLGDAVEAAAREAGMARERALAGRPGGWEAALAVASSALRRAEELAAQAPGAFDPDLRERLGTLRTALDADERDRRFAGRFDEILGGVLVWDARRRRAADGETFAALREAFRSHYGLDPAEAPAADAAAVVRGRPEAVRRDLLAALDVCLATAPREDAAARRRLEGLLGAADDDPWRRRARAARAAGDGAALEGLLKEADVAAQRPALLLFLAGYLPEQAWAAKQDVLAGVRRQYPGEAWAHGRFAAATSHDLFAWQLVTAPDPGPRDARWAVGLAREAVRVSPNDGDFRNTLGVALYRAGDWGQAAETLEGVVRLSEGGGPADWLFLAMARWRLGDRDEARRWYRRAAAWRRVGGEAPGDELIPLFRAEAARLLGEKESGGNQRGRDEP